MGVSKKVRQEKAEIIMAVKQAEALLKSLGHGEDVSGLLVSWIVEGMEKARERAWEIDLLG